MTFAEIANPASYEDRIQIFIDSERKIWSMNSPVFEIALKKYEGRSKIVVIAIFYGTSVKKSGAIVSFCKNTTLFI